MNNVDESYQNIENEIRISKMGYKFELHAEKWQLDNTFTLNWAQYDDLKLDKSLMEGCRKTLAVFSSEMSAKYVRNIFNFFKILVRFSETKLLTVVSVQNYLATLDKESEYKLGYIKAFLLDWHYRGNKGVSNEVARFLNSVKLKGNVKGKAVSKSCPHSGAYNMNEQQAILEWSVNAFINNKLSLEEYTWLLLHMYLGFRPIQFRALAVGDLVIHTHDNFQSYSLKRSEAKQRDAGFREIQTEIDVDEDLALLILNQSNSSIAFIESHFGEKLSTDLIKSIPIFLNRKNITKIRSIDEFIVTQKNTPDFVYMDGNSAFELMNYISSKNQARTERLNGEYIHLSSRRFRYTLGTNARRKGLNEYQIAKILGHSDIQNVKVYVENTNEVVDLIDEAMTTVLAPLAQAFAGTLIENEREAIQANDPRSRIKASNGSGVGNCGEFGFCASGGRQCYLCTKFQPWIHGQHEKVLQSVNNERESLRKRGASDFVIQSTDRVVLAITQVIQLCNKKKGHCGISFKRFKDLSGQTLSNNLGWLRFETKIHVVDIFISPYKILFTFDK